MTTTLLLMNVALSATVVGILAFAMSRAARVGSSLGLVSAEAKNAVDQAPAPRTHRRVLMRDPQTA
jgi:hypothetical protein